MNVPSVECIIDRALLIGAYRDWLATPPEDRAFLCSWLEVLRLERCLPMQRALFTLAGLDRVFPFPSYSPESANPARLAWVEHILAGKFPEEFKLPMPQVPGDRKND